MTLLLLLSLSTSSSRRHHENNFKSLINQEIKLAAKSTVQSSYLTYFTVKLINNTN